MQFSGADRLLMGRMSPFTTYGSRPTAALRGGKISARYSFEGGYGAVQVQSDCRRLVLSNFGFGAKSVGNKDQ